MAGGVVLAVMLQDILQTLVQIHHHVMAHPLVGVIDDLTGGEPAFCVAAGIVLPQEDMLLHDGGNFRIAVVSADFAVITSYSIHYTKLYECSKETAKRDRVLK